MIVMTSILISFHLQVISSIMRTRETQLPPVIMLNSSQTMVTTSSIFKHQWIFLKFLFINRNLLVNPLKRFFLKSRFFALLKIFVKKIFWSSKIFWEFFVLKYLPVYSNIHHMLTRVCKIPANANFLAAGELMHARVWLAS